MRRKKKVSEPGARFAGASLKKRASKCV